MAADRADRAVFLAVLVTVGFGDSILLPFDYTQRISLANWHYLDTRYVAFTVAFALAMAWVLTLQVHAMRVVVANTSSSRAARRGGPIGVLAAVVSLLPSFVCCSPIVPTLVGALGLSATSQLHTTWHIEYFFATRQNLLLLGSLLLVVVSGLWSMRKLVRADCLTGTCRAAHDGGADGNGRAEPPAPPGQPAEAALVGANQNAEEPRR